MFMHPLVHAWAKDRMHKKQQRQVWISTACVVALSLRKTQLWRTHERWLRPQMQSFIYPRLGVLLSFGRKEMMLPLIVQCSWALIVVGEQSRLQTLLQRLYEALRISPWTPMPEYSPIWRLASTAAV